jgi:hypothetical protein
VGRPAGACPRAVPRHQVLKHRAGANRATSPGNGPRAALRITASAAPSAKVHSRQTIPFPCGLAVSAACCRAAAQRAAAAPARSAPGAVVPGADGGGGGQRLGQSVGPHRSERSSDTCRTKRPGGVILGW